MAQETPALLQKPLYIFNLPEEILHSLTPKSEAPGVAQAGTESASLPPREAALSSTQSPDGAVSPPKATSCSLCGLTFTTLQEQRSHARSDLHNYNLKQKLRGLKPVHENEFERMIGDLDESLSGSDSSATDSEGEDTDGKDSTLVSLLRRQAKLSAEDQGEQNGTSRKHGPGTPPLIWFASSSLPSGFSLGVYRAIFSKAEEAEPAHIVDTIRRKQLAPIYASSNSRNAQATTTAKQSTSSSPHYFLCMIGGGHFAAMVVSLAPKIAKAGTAGSADRQAVVLAHKTFHRYTTRRKQGGSQSANDNAKGTASSAGSALRRYNEVALTNEVRSLLSEWKDMIASSELLFIRATGTTNRNTLFGSYEGQVLRHNDPRIRGFPFSTRRATQKELMRAFVELTRVKVNEIDEAALAAAAAEQAKRQQESQQQAQQKAQQPRTSKPTAEEEAALLHTSQIQALIRRSKAPALLSYLSTNKITPEFRFAPANQNYHAPTPLHLAASSNSAAIVTALLVKAKADPAVKSEEGKTPFEVAGDRPTRDAFRLARHELSEAAWDWDAAAVPAPLTPAAAADRTRQEKQAAEEEAHAESERRKADLEKLRQAEREKIDHKRNERFGKGKSLASGIGVEKTAQEKREEEARGMTPEMQMRLERERRARAAEERLKRMQGGGGGR